MTTNAEGVLDRLTESVIAKVAVRIVLPLLMLVCIPLAVAQWNGMRSDVNAVSAKVDGQGEKMAAMERDVTTINTKLDAGLIWRLTQLERNFETMQARMDRREAQPPRQ